MNSLIVVHINANGLRARLTELSTLLAEADPPVDLLLVNETKLNGCAPPKIPGFIAAATRDKEAGSRGRSPHIRRCKLKSQRYLP